MLNEKPAESATRRLSEREGHGNRRPFLPGCQTTSILPERRNVPDSAPGARKLARQQTVTMSAGLGICLSTFWRPPPRPPIPLAIAADRPDR